MWIPSRIGHIYDSNSCGVRVAKASFDVGQIMLANPISDDLVKFVGVLCAGGVRGKSWISQELLAAHESDYLLCCGGRRAGDCEILPIARLVDVAW